VLNPILYVAFDGDADDDHYEPISGDLDGQCQGNGKDRFVAALKSHSMPFLTNGESES